MSEKKIKEEQTNNIISSSDVVLTSISDFIKAAFVAAVIFQDRSVNTAFTMTLVVIMNTFISYLKIHWKQTLMQKFGAFVRKQGIIRLEDLTTAKAQAKEDGLYVPFGWEMTTDIGKRFGMQLFLFVGNILAATDGKISASLAFDPAEKEPKYNGVMLGLFKFDPLFSIRNIMSGISPNELIPVYITKTLNYVCIGKTESGAPAIYCKNKTDFAEFYNTVSEVNVPIEWLNEKLDGTKPAYTGKNLTITYINGPERRTETYQPFLIRDWVSHVKESVVQLVNGFSNNGEYHKPGNVSKIIILVTGPPGTGKTSLVYVIGTILKKDIVSYRFNGDIGLFAKMLQENANAVIMVDELTEFVDMFQRRIKTKEESKESEEDKKQQIAQLTAERTELLKSMNLVGDKEKANTRLTEQRISQIDHTINGLMTNGSFATLLQAIDNFKGVLVLAGNKPIPKIETALDRRINLNITLNYFNHRLIVEMVRLIYENIASEEELKSFAEGKFPEDRYTGSNIEKVANGGIASHYLTEKTFYKGKLLLKILFNIMTNPDFYPESQDEDAKTFATATTQKDNLEKLINGKSPEDKSTDKSPDDKSPDDKLPDDKSADKKITIPDDSDDYINTDGLRKRTTKLADDNN